MSRKVVVLTAGLSQPSSTRLLADQLAAAVSAAVGGRGESVELEVIELRELATELAATMATGGIPTPAITAVRERISQADGLIAVTPVFAASYSGLFKMFFDILDPDALNAMPVLIAATAGTPATPWCSTTPCAHSSPTCARSSSPPASSPPPRISAPPV